MNWKEALGEDFGNKVLETLKELARGLSVAAEHVYGVLVRQQIVYGISAMIGCLIGIIVLSYAMYKIGKWLIKNDEAEFLSLFAFPIGGLIGLFFGFFDGFMHCFNPEYYAIKEILDAISGK